MADIYHPPTLRHLRIMTTTAADFSPGFVQVIAHLGVSATQLTLQTLGEVAADVSVFPEGVSFSSVETLTVVNDEPVPANISRPCFV